jgi:antitoxin YefM
MKTVQFSETGNDLNALLERVASIKDGLKVMRADGSAIVMMTNENYRSLRETAYLLSSPANAAHLAQSLAELHAGQVSAHELIEVSDSDAQPPPPVHK